MNEKEYKAQKATGTIDYLKAAITTTSKKVLASIVEDTNDADVHLVVATNKGTDARTLTRLIVDRNSTETILNSCIWHPAVTRYILETWMKRSYIANMPAAKQRLYGMQVMGLVRKEDRIDLDIDFEEQLQIFKGINRKSNSWTTAPYLPQVYGDTDNTNGIQIKWLADSNTLIGAESSAMMKEVDDDIQLGELLSYTFDSNIEDMIAPNIGALKFDTDED